MSGAALTFTFDGKTYAARPGQTLAAALLDNGVAVVARSFKYHRPRGIMAAGVEEPSALVTVGEGGRAEPNTRATDVFVYQGLVARSQNVWPSLAFDVGAINGLASRLIPAGFYYKTFFGPPRRWMVYERFIRKAAGLGPAPADADPDSFDHRAAFCDVLVVGAGPAGLAAALAATQAGQRVMLVEQDALPGGALLREDVRIDGVAGGDWAAQAVAQIRAGGGRVLLRATATGYWDGNLVSVVQRLAEPGQVPAAAAPVQCLWKVRCGKVLLATGAIERPLAFGGNDRPGVMLAQAVRAYVRRHGVVPGRRAVVATSNDDGYRTAFALADAGAQVVAVLDSRPAPDSAIVEQARGRFAVLTDARPIDTRARGRRLATVIAQVGGGEQRMAADLLAMSGGFTPVAHLHKQAGGDLAWDAAAQAFVPGTARQAQASIGAAAGGHDLAAILAQGWAAGSGGAPRGFAVDDPLGMGTPAGAAAVPQAARGKVFVDFQNDVTLSDIDLAWREGYRSVEHLKRYTTLGMGTDQGKTGNMAALARLAQAQGVDIPQAGLTTFRPPYTPTTLGAFAGAAVGEHAGPVRRLRLHQAHDDLGAAWQPVGYWFRPRSYPRAGESLGVASLREARMVRQSVGMVDVSTLATFEVSGPDAAALLEMACATTIGRLGVGRGRYTVMLREDGLVMDDGTAWRLAEQRYLLTSSTGGADRMAQHLSWLRNVMVPHLKVSVVNVQEHLGAVALAGPQAARVLAGLTGAEAPAHMRCTRAVLAGVDVLILAASYSGERAFEVYAPGHQLRAVWDALHGAAVAAGGGAYGLDAMDHLRVEKGHVVIGAEVDGRVSAQDIGLGGMLRKSGGFVGWQGQQRPAIATASGRRQLVGLTVIGSQALPEGAMLVTQEGLEPLGHVTTAAPRVAGEGWIGLALLIDGTARHGQELLAWSATRNLRVPVRVCDPVFYDREGARYRD
ncbi:MULTISPECIES: 2Fe-2S iron-sulfur cluster-binding protein [unclassified Novosphingobium]|uniref:2Fe-2S iron-sulfur cluster-binding protein n=1 Tax=unclassified Novosphingobium TaxID=2644732 RepID=UPI000D2F5329|nr:MULTISPECIES: 2Fe-2S iron-sulfur cluster-binding protein [unclassified Novosphingobium]PTR13076.1 sarcosine oxidase subunit alpha [Novosphingobium sp. GV055]PUB07295.1 sarcosine oxidase subunit alpha [Novosphingobium sp. GV061]PUB23108.1 sarcosine oxidase subunit alpha [Novosphingobium sp. GV079]PUB44872.1 sarcosine oxidase subunit alpha [Novosphingobium sp. GV027]